MTDQLFLLDKYTVLLYSYYILSAATQQKGWLFWWLVPLWLGAASYFSCQLISINYWPLSIITNTQCDPWTYLHEAGYLYPTFIGRRIPSCHITSQTPRWLSKPSATSPDAAWPGKRATEQDRHPNAVTSASAQQEEEENDEDDEPSNKKQRLDEGTEVEEEGKVAEEDEDSEPSDEEDDWKVVR